MAGQPAHRKQLYDWDDYRSWDDGKRWEIIGGQVYDMSPAPVISHQLISGALSAEFARVFRDQKCRFLHAPADLKLSDHDIVQPDLMVICDPKKITRTHIEGAPDLVVEILSPSTALKDRTVKMRLYATTGVKELWIVSPTPPMIDVFLLDGPTYRLVGSYGKMHTLKSATFEKLKINLKRVFDFPEDTEEPSNAVHESAPAPYRVNRRRKRTK